MINQRRLDVPCFAVLTACLIATGCGSGMTPAFTNQQERIVQSLQKHSKLGAARILVCAPDLDDQAFKTLGRTYRLEHHKTIAPLGLAVFGVQNAKESDLRGLMVDPRVRYVERDTVGRLSDTIVPNDPGFAHQWNLRRMRAPEAWAETKGSEKVIVAVLDTGVDMRHPDLAGKLVPGTNISNPDALPVDDLGHGTCVAGIIGSMTDNGEGFAGVAPRAKIMPIKINEPGTGAVRISEAVMGIVWAVDNGAHVLNMSVGFSKEEEEMTLEGLRTLSSAIEYALDRHVTVVCAAGNIGKLPMETYPAYWANRTGYEGLISVGTIDRSDKRTSYSNYGPWLSVVAPADNVPTLNVGGNYGVFGGTSAAAPHVSGLAALLIDPTQPIQPKTVAARIMQSARDLGAPGRDDEYGAGCIDALATVMAGRHSRKR